MNYKIISENIKRDFQRGETINADEYNAGEAFVYRYGGTNGHQKDYAEYHPDEWAMLEKMVVEEEE